MLTQIYWIPGPWPGKLGIAARPRGGDWLDDEVAGWRRAEVSTVVSLLTPQEEIDLELKDERRAATQKGIKFLSLPIEDRSIPASDAKAMDVIDRLEADLCAGKNVVIHCRQGIGRSAVIAACLLIGRGSEPDAAIEVLRKSRGQDVPETAEQRQWIQRYAVAIASSK
jgi:protein-tyrosine phosphatase